ncbi:MAG TPA: hypothetical protein DCO83_15480 [Mucilaginibacter sp.]|nr:hypothetical protein [Mucilaginibacter sp.]
MFKRKIFIVGFGYQNDIIVVRQSKITLQTVKIDTNNVDSNRVCSFYETFSYYTFSGNVSLNIEIDSATHKLLDTVVVLTEKNERPFISFEKPTETKCKRKFFVGDESKFYIK